MDVEIVSPDVHLQQDDTKISHIVKAIGSLLNTIFEYKFTKANHILFEDIIILHPLNNGSINIRRFLSILNSINHLLSEAPKKARNQSAQWAPPI